MPGRNRFGVSRRNGDRVGRVEPVEPVRKVDEVDLERIALRVLERRERLQSRAVPEPEERHELLGRGEPPREGAFGDLERVDAVAEKLAEMTLGAPEHRRLQARRRRDVLADGAEELADEAVRR